MAKSKEQKVIRITKRKLVQTLSDAFKQGKAASFADLAGYLVEALKLGRWGDGYPLTRNTNKD